MDQCSSNGRPDAARKGAAAPSAAAHQSSGGSISLPVLPSDKPSVRKSKSGWKRALVLTGVWLFMIAHFVQWLAMGTTLAPIEPSESMETAKAGIITVGTIFFVTAIISTMILGRWFCGWGCHWVALQDGATWLLKRVGVRPKPFRSRLLVWVPLLLAVYMFIWPLIYRFAVAPWIEPANPALAWPGFSVHLVTTDFWATFPGVMMSIPFTLVCSALIIYLMGSKGYCTYACPYGGFFAPAEEVAPMRIVVDADKCHQCGHCTAVCTSNVRVHEEVRDYGMVVDPGCMKCLDCVSVCPNEALSFGVGKPAMSVKRAGTRAAASAEKRFDLTWPEEITLFALAWLVFLAVRGNYLGLPLLFASGLSACTVFIAWKAWRVVRDRNASFHQWQLRFHGAFRPAGLAWVGGAAVLLLSTSYVGTMNGLLWAADRFDLRVTVPAEVVYAESRAQLPDAMERDARLALELYRAASMAPEGWSVLPLAQTHATMRSAWLYSTLGEFAAAEAELRKQWERGGPDEHVAAGLGRVMRVQDGGLERTRAWYLEQLAAHPEWQGLREEQITWLAFMELYDDIIPSARAGLAAYPDNLLAMRRLSLSLVEYGQDELALSEGVELIRKTLEIEPNNAAAHAALGRGLLRLNRKSEALMEFERAGQLAPESETIQKMLEEVRAANPNPLAP